jgi:hypothetical protein
MSYYLKKDVLLLSSSENASLAAQMQGSIEVSLQTGQEDPVIMLECEGRSHWF